MSDPLKIVTGCQSRIFKIGWKSGVTMGEESLSLFFFQGYPMVIDIMLFGLK